MAKNFPQNNKPTDPNSSTNYSRNNMKKITSRHSIINLLKAHDEKKILKATRGKGDMYTGTKKRMTTDFLSQTMQMRRQGNNIFKVLREKLST